MAHSQTVRKRIEKFSNGIISNIFGAAYFLFLGLFILISLPVYIFRMLAIYLAKALRPDFGANLNGQSSIYASDYFSETPPRANIVASTFFEHGLTWEQMKQRIVETWIHPRDKSTGKLIYEQFQQYPISWMGFVFWKNAFDTFSIDNHVYNEGKGTVVTEDNLSEIVERILNSKIQRNKSPWEIYVVENHLTVEGNFETVVITKWHHCLADGMSMYSACLKAFSEDYPTKDLARPLPNFSSRTTCWQHFLFLLSFPFKMITEIPMIFSHQLKYNPWKVSDKRKQWNQIYTKSSPIPTHVIKIIKNHFNVSFASVILSAISAATQKCILQQKNSKEGGGRWDTKSMLFFNILPKVKSQSAGNLTNCFTASLLNLNIGSFASSAERLKNVNLMLNMSKSSVQPVMYSILTTLMGCHFCEIGAFLLKNRMVAMGLTNFAGIPDKTTLYGRSCLRADVVTGCLDGVAGVAITAHSQNQLISIQACAEAAVMSRKELQDFIKFATEEIYVLLDIVNL